MLYDILAGHMADGTPMAVDLSLDINGVANGEVYTIEDIVKNKATIRSIKNPGKTRRILLGDKQYRYYNTDEAASKEQSLYIKFRYATREFKSAQEAFYYLISKVGIGYSDCRVSTNEALTGIIEMMLSIRGKKAEEALASLISLRNACPPSEKNLIRYKVGNRFGFVRVPRYPDKDEYLVMVLKIASDFGWSVFWAPSDKKRSDCKDVA